MASIGRDRLQQPPHGRQKHVSLTSRDNMNPRFMSGWAMGGRVMAAAAISAAIVGGWLVSTGRSEVAIAVCSALAAVMVFVRWPGLFVALTILAVMNGVPVIDLSQRIVGSFGLQDCAVFVLIACLYRWRAPISNDRQRKTLQVIYIWSAGFLAWWIVTFARSVILAGVPARYAASYGRDFLYFAILLPVVAKARLPRRDTAQCTYLLFAGALVYALGQVAVSLSGRELSWLVHANHSNLTDGQLRIYSPMSALASTALIFTGAWLLAGPDKRHKAPIAALTGILVVAAALELTRSNYVALGAAFVIGVTLHVIRGGSLIGVLTRTAAAGAVVVAFMLVLNVADIGGSGVGEAATRVAARAESSFVAVSRSNGTFGYRAQLDGTMLRLLGTQWPIGLGFLNPTVHYVAGLPEGAIRNADLGVFNALMTMGIVGTLFIYAPLLYVFVKLLQALGRLQRSAWHARRWVAYGGGAWVAWALVGSWNLVVLFSVGGLITAALVIGFLAHAQADDSPVEALSVSTTMPKLTVEHP